MVTLSSLHRESPGSQEVKGVAIRYVVPDQVIAGVRFVADIAATWCGPMTTWPVASSTATAGMDVSLS